MQHDGTCGNAQTLNNKQTVNPHRKQLTDSCMRPPRGVPQQSPRVSRATPSTYCCPPRSTAHQLVRPAASSSPPSVMEQEPAARAVSVPPSMALPAEVDTPGSRAVEDWRAEPGLMGRACSTTPGGSCCCGCPACGACCADLRAAPVGEVLPVPPPSCTLLRLAGGGWGGERVAAPAYTARCTQTCNMEASARHVLPTHTQLYVVRAGGWGRV